MAIPVGTASRCSGERVIVAEAGIGGQIEARGVARLVTRQGLRAIAKALNLDDGYGHRRSAAGATTLSQILKPHATACRISANRLEAASQRGYSTHVEPAGVR